MALLRSVKSSRTYKDYSKNVYKKVIPSPATRPIQIEIVNDRYFKLSTRDDTRLSRAEGEESRRIHLNGVGQSMPQGDQWHTFFNNKDNKEDLISLAVSFFKSDGGRRLLYYPFIINIKEETWKITRQTVQLLQRCNHEEADYRMVFHAGQTQSKAVIVAKDSDVLNLTVICNDSDNRSKLVNEMLM